MTLVKEYAADDFQGESMQFKKIFGPARIDTTSNGTIQAMKLSPTPGGKACKVVQYMVKVLSSSGANVRITVELWQGPDGTVSSLHSIPINAGNPGTNLPSLLTGDCDASKIVGEYLMPVVAIADSAATNPQWAVIELFEMRKPF